MKLYAIVEIEDEIFDDYKEWYISADDLSIRYVDEDGLMHYKSVKDDLLELKSLPLRKMHESIVIANGKEYCRLNAFDDYEKGWNACIDQILGEEGE